MNNLALLSLLKQNITFAFTLSTTTRFKLHLCRVVSCRFASRRLYSFTTCVPLTRNHHHLQLNWFYCHRIVNYFFIHFNFYYHHYYNLFKVVKCCLSFTLIFLCFLDSRFRSRHRSRLFQSH